MVQLEFNKVQDLLLQHCKTDFAQQECENLRIHTHIDYINKSLHQTHEFKLILQTGQYFPIDFTLNIQKDIKLLSIPGASLSGEQYNLLRRLLDNAADIFRWFDAERREAFF